MGCEKNRSLQKDCQVTELSPALKSSDLGPLATPHIPPILCSWPEREGNFCSLSFATQVRQTSFLSHSVTPSLHYPDTFLRCAVLLLPEDILLVCLLQLSPAVPTPPLNSFLVLRRQPAAHHVSSPPCVNATPGHKEGCSSGYAGCLQEQ